MAKTVSCIDMMKSLDTDDSSDDSQEEENNKQNQQVDIKTVTYKEYLTATNKTIHKNIFALKKLQQKSE